MGVPSFLSAGNPAPLRRTTSRRPRPVISMRTGAAHRYATGVPRIAAHAASTAWHLATPVALRQAAVSAPEHVTTESPSRESFSATQGPTTLAAAIALSDTRPPVTSST